MIEAMVDRYSWSGRKLHVLRGENETWCGGAPGDETYESFSDARKEHGHFGSISQCQECLTAKHSTDTAKGNINVSTTGVQ